MLPRCRRAHRERRSCQGEIRVLLIVRFIRIITGFRVLVLRLAASFLSAFRLRIFVRAFRIFLAGPRKLVSFAQQGQVGIVDHTVAVDVTGEVETRLAVVARQQGQVEDVHDAVVVQIGRVAASRRELSQRPLIQTGWLAGAYCRGKYPLILRAKPQKQAELVQQGLRLQVTGFIHQDGQLSPLAQQSKSGRIRPHTLVWSELEGQLSVLLRLFQVHVLSGRVPLASGLANGLPERGVCDIRAEGVTLGSSEPKQEEGHEQEGRSSHRLASSSAATRSMTACAGASKPSRRRAPLSSMPRMVPSWARSVSSCSLNRPWLKPTMGE